MRRDVSKKFDISSQAVSAILISNQIGQTSEIYVTSVRVMEPIITIFDMPNELFYFTMLSFCLCLFRELTIEYATLLNVNR